MKDMLNALEDTVYKFYEYACEDNNKERTKEYMLKAFGAIEFFKELCGFYENIGEYRADVYDCFTSLMETQK